MININMYIAAVVLVVLWLLGLLTGMTFGGWIHLLLVVAIVLAGMKMFGNQGGGGTPGM
jgi:hypothetical protein